MSPVIGLPAVDTIHSCELAADAWVGTRPLPTIPRGTSHASSTIARDTDRLTPSWSLAACGIHAEPSGREICADPLALRTSYPPNIGRPPRGAGAAAWSHRVGCAVGAPVTIVAGSLEAH